MYFFDMFCCVLCLKIKKITKNLLFFYFSSFLVLNLVVSSNNSLDNTSKSFVVLSIFSIAPFAFSSDKMALLNCFVVFSVIVAIFPIEFVISFTPIVCSCVAFAT